MALQMSVAMRNGRLDQVESVIGVSAIFRVTTGAVPADCAAADAGTLLISITLPSDWMNAASTGTKTKLGTWSGAATGTGTPGHFRVKETTGTTVGLQGTAAVGSGDLNFDGSITSGQTVTISTFTLTELGA